MENLNNNNINNNNDSKTKPHIPYRDSKLTRLLQNSLGGNAKTVIILTVSAARRHLAETLSTLRFGARARQIQIRPTANRSQLEDQAQMKRQYSKAVQENRELQELVAQLQEELHSARSNGNNSSSNNSNQNKHDLNVSDGGGEAVCEICRDFLNLKLRDERTGGGGDGNISALTNAAPTTNNRKKNTNVPSSNLAPIDTGFSPTIDDHNNNNINNNYNEDIDPDYPLTTNVEPLERCAICGLSAEEADKLQLYTGEVLGEMFSCDGNCGHQFHVRCVGE